MSVFMRLPMRRKYHEFAPGNGSFEIEDLQAQLNMLGFGLEVNGKWDGPTQAAVLEFKGAVGLPNTTLCDSDFADALYNALEQIDPRTGQKKNAVVQMDPINIEGRTGGGVGWLLLALGVGIALFW